MQLFLAMHESGTIASFCYFSSRESDNIYLVDPEKVVGMGVKSQSMPETQIVVQVGLDM